MHMGMISLSQGQGENLVYRELTLISIYIASISFIISKGRKQEAEYYKLNVKCETGFQIINIFKTKQELTTE